jgi:hypothetical protein
VAEMSKILKLNKIVALLIICVLITSCSQSSSDELNPQQSSSVGTSGQLISIQSDNVMAAGYDDMSAVMTVQFKNGAVYEYYGVSAVVWQAFIAAQPHPWSQVGYPELVKSGIPYKRIR